jgi:hypothetical protein
MTTARRFNAGIMRRTGQVPEGRLNNDKIAKAGKFRRPVNLKNQPSLRDLVAVRKQPGNKLPGYFQIVPLGR